MQELVSHLVVIQAYLLDLAVDNGLGLPLRGRGTNLRNHCEVTKANDEIKSVSQLLMSTLNERYFDLGQQTFM